MSSAISVTVCFLFGRLLFGGCWTFSLEIDGGESFFLEGSCCFFGRFGCRISDEHDDDDDDDDDALVVHSESLSLSESKNAFVTVLEAFRESEEIPEWSSAKVDGM